MPYPSQLPNWAMAEPDNLQSSPGMLGGMFSAPGSQEMLLGIGIGLLESSGQRKGIGEGLSRGLLYGTQFKQQAERANLYKKAGEREDKQFARQMTEWEREDALRKQKNAQIEAVIAKEPDPAKQALMRANPEATLNALAEGLKPTKPERFGGEAGGWYEYTPGSGEPPRLVQPGIGREPKEAPVTWTTIKDENGLPVQVSSRGERKEAPGGGGSGPFTGKGMDSESWNMLVRGQSKLRTGQQLSPDEQDAYIAAYSNLATPRSTYDPMSGGMVTMTPKLPFPDLRGGQPSQTGGATTPQPQADDGTPLPGSTLGPQAGTQPDVKVTDVMAGRKQRAAVDEQLVAYNDMVSTANDLRGAIAGGLDYTDQRQKGAVTALLGSLKAAIAVADQKGVLQPGESKDLDRDLGDPTSFLSYLGNQVGGAFDVVERMDSFLGQRLATASEKLLNRATEAGIDPNDFTPKLMQLRRPKLPGEGVPTATGTPGGVTYEDILP